MKKFYEQIVHHSKLIMTVFVVAAIVGVAAKGLVSVNYDMTDYLPDDAKSTVSLDVMSEEFAGGIPNARVMIKDVTIAEALEYKEKLKACTGVSDVLWLDDSIGIHEPLEMQDAQTVENFYKENTALFTVTIEENLRDEAVSEIRTLIGEDNAMSGDAVSTAIATQSTVKEISTIAVFAVLVVFLILFLTTTEWVTPLIVMAGLGVAIMINAGSNLIFGEISFVTNAAGNVLQLAVSLDYSVFLIHRFEESRKQISNPKEAMVDALCKSTTSILSSGLTTVIGFLVLLFMKFQIGPDLGRALAKGVAISLLTVFLFMPGVILSCNKWIEKTHHKPLLPSFQKFGNFVSKVMIPMVIVFVLLIVPSYLASNSNSFYYGASHIFGPETQCGRDIQEIEEVFGQRDTYVVLVPKGDTAKEEELSQSLHNIKEVKSIISYVDTVGLQIPEQYLDADTVAKLESENYSRMVLSVETAYEGEETFALVEQIRDTVNEYYPDAYYMAGQGVSTYDLMDSITADMTKVNLIAIGAVFLVLLLSMKSISIPVILVLGIETAIWINLAIPYFKGSVIFYIAYLIISSIQLGATVDYAILLTDRYMELREGRNKMEAVKDTVSNVTVSVLTSGIVLSVVGFLLGIVSTHGILSQLGMFLGKGSLLSMTIVLFVLPGLLYLFDEVIQKTTK